MVNLDLIASTAAAYSDAFMVLLALKSKREAEQLPNRHSPSPHWKAENSLGITGSRLEAGPLPEAVLVAVGVGEVLLVRRDCGGQHKRLVLGAKLGASNNVLLMVHNKDPFDEVVVLRCHAFCLVHGHLTQM